MTSLTVPDIASQTDIRAFLRALIDVNQERRKQLSLRWFAGKLAWPPSYLNDVLAERRQLTLNRCLELAQLLELSIDQSEQLLLLTLAGAKEPLVGDYFKRELAQRFGPKDPGERRLGVFESVSATLIWSYLVLRGQRPTGDEVRAKLYTLPELSDADLASYTDQLIAEGRLLADGDKLEAPRRHLEFTPTGTDKATAAVESLQNLVRYVRSPRRQSPGHFGMRFALVPVAIAAEAERKLRQVNDWLASVSAGNDLEVDRQAGDRQIYQLLYFFAPMIDHEA